MKQAAVIALCTRQGSAQVVAQKLGVRRPTLYNWKNQLLGPEASASMKRRHETPPSPEREELERQLESLRRDIHRLQLEHAKGAWGLRAGLLMCTCPERIRPATAHADHVAKAHRAASTAAPTSFAFPNAIWATGSSVDGSTTLARSFPAGNIHSSPIKRRSRRPVLVSCSTRHIAPSFSMIAQKKNRNYGTSLP